MRSESTTITWQPTRGAQRRLRFEPYDDQLHRIEEVWTGCAWRQTGVETVTGLDITPTATDQTHPPATPTQHSSDP
ncbi:hypothetical protein [Haloarcula nitratireducens]|uniref:Uncharacterized protein n=1 Tax=Haloarcula nitratireducens TaxID=2487749 RepID=A0AAW4PFI9_9EURY|nr:hypothetical protein [Halomicroarcula nitratireducens]MBX0296656.1 hypothetical protein [Halomicroarcula nitratireducens]